MKRIFSLILVLVVFSALYSSMEAKACIVGDLSQAPTITITSAPPDCCYGLWAGTITGEANNLDTDSVAVVLYAQTNLYWVQPYTFAKWTSINCDGTFSNDTHGGHHYCAILAKKTWDPPNTMGYLPSIGEEILAITCVPTEPRTINFGGYRWQIKQTGSVKMDPGPNYWSDLENNVWVDEQGRLHLKITNIDGKWWCSEVFTDAYLGYGCFQFEVESPIDELVDNVVFAGFIYSDQGDEIDIEFSQTLAAPNNAQYAIQPWTTPGNYHSFPFDQIGVKSSHEFEWQANKIVFVSRQGEISEKGELIESWIYEGSDNPIPDIERFRFNLWLVGGNPPGDRQEVEVIISAFVFPGTSTGVRETSWSAIKQMYKK